MNIAENSRYLDMTSSLRDVRLKDKIQFRSDGFSYMSASLALVMLRESKNNYVLRTIYGGGYHMDTCDSCAKAVDLAKRAIALDIEGYLTKH